MFPEGVDLWNELILVLRNGLEVGCSARTSARAEVRSVGLTVAVAEVDHFSALVPEDEDLVLLFEPSLEVLVDPVDYLVLWVDITQLFKV